MVLDAGLATEDSVIRMEGVSKTFGSQPVLRDLSFDVKGGESFAIVGPSGCGKSVTLKILIGLLRCDSGRVWIWGEDITQAPEAVLDRLRRKMAMVFQGGALFDSLTVGENVAFPLDQHTELAAAEKAAIVGRNLTRVGLPGIEQKMPSELSGGMRKRVALARAIALEPEIILFDEPTTGLDPITTTEISLLIRRLRDDLQMTSIVVTHDIGSAFRVASRIGVHNDGQLIAIGTPGEIRDSNIPFVRRFLQGLPAAGNHEAGNAGGQPPMPAGETA